MKKATYPRTLCKQISIIRSWKLNAYIQYSLNDEEELIEESSDWPEGRQYDTAEQAERCHSGCFFLLAQDRETVLQVVPNPQSTMHGCSNEHPASGPSVHIIKLLVPMAGTEKERQNGVLSRK